MKTESESEYEASFVKKRVGSYVFFFDPRHPGAQQNAESFLHPKNGPSRAVERAVHIYQEQGVVLKYSKPTRWKVRLRNGLRLKGSGKHCLADEFHNLARLDRSSLSPQAYGYVRRWYFGFLCEELLVLEYIPESRTVDDVVLSKEQGVESVLSYVFAGFSEMLAEGFVHLDPHPGNILLTAQGDVRFVDFEGCCFDDIDEAFSLAFCMGRFYRFWFFKFMAEAVYDDIVASFVFNARFSLGEQQRFWPTYSAFKKEDTSRKQCRQYFTSRRIREKFIASSALSYPNK